MMGQLSSGQERLFYSFNLEDHIPANHLLRSIDRCLDLSDLLHYLADFYSPIGRPSIDPELMIRMLIVGYCYGIRSERRLCEEAHLMERIQSIAINAGLNLLRVPSSITAEGFYASLGFIKVRDEFHKSERTIIMTKILDL